MFRKKKKNSVVRNHCQHCTGNFGRCACNFGCPVKEGVTKCSATSFHCHHCTGGQGLCNCRFQCPAKPESQCTTVHFGVNCAGNCVGDLTGPRYRCAICPKFDVCMKCFFDGDHDVSHNFLKIERPGSVPINVPARGGDNDCKNIDLQVVPPSQQNQGMTPPTRFPRPPPLDSSPLQPNRQTPQSSKKPFIPPQPIVPPPPAAMMSPSKMPSTVMVSRGDTRVAGQQDEISCTSFDQSHARSRGGLPDSGDEPLPVEKQNRASSRLSKFRQQRGGDESEEGKGQRELPASTSGPGISARNGPPESSDGARQAALAQKALLINPDDLPVAEVVVTGDGASIATGTTSVASHCSFQVGQVVRLQGLNKLNMNGRFGTIDAITATHKAIVRVKGHNNPVVVGSKYLVEAFPPDTVVLLPDQNPGIVVSSGNKKVSVMNPASGKEMEYEPEDLTLLEEIS